MNDRGLNPLKAGLGPRAFSADTSSLKLMRLSLAVGGLLLSLTHPARAQADPPEAAVLQRFASPAPPLPQPTPWRDNEFSVDADSVIVFTGQTNTVRHQRDGRLEAALMLGLHERSARVRFMAWEADTVYEQWRELNFGSWPGQLAAAEAGIVVLQYGQMEALDGPGRLAEFTAAFHRLIDQFAQVTPRLVLVSPTPFETAMGADAPDLSVHNKDLALYVAAIREIARQRNLLFVDLYHPLVEQSPDSPRLTDNGVHLNALGLELTAAEIGRQLQLAETPAPDGLLIDLIAKKNRLWFDSWRPANWSFVYGDRITQLFATGIDEEPSLRELFEQHKPLIAELDERIQTVAAGAPDPGPTMLPAEPPPLDSSLVPTIGEQLAAFTVANGFEIELFADESMGVVKPTHMAWDEHGRLYVACSPTYPHTLPGVPPGDYIWVGEDRSGDGNIDHSWRLIEGLTMVHGIVPGDGGLYICDFDRLLHARDTTGDGKADDVRVLLQGFGIGDTHQIINSISWDQGGRLWFTQGLHAFSRVETPHGIARLHQSGVWRFNPRTLKLDAFFNGAKAGHNGWGIVFDDFGQVFHKSGDRPAGYYSVPGLIAIDDPTEYHPIGALFDTQPKTSALELIGTSALPDEWQGGAVISGYMGHLIEIHRIFDDGSGFASEQLPRPLTSDNQAFRPIGTSIGPDGAIYIADWSNLLIGHYQHSYADPRRDRHHGRIWRLRSTEHEPVTPPDLAGMNVYELVKQLGSGERWIREQARRLLFSSSSTEVLAAVSAQFEPEQSEADNDERLLIEWIGLLEAHEAPDLDLLDRLLTAGDPRVRAYGTRVIGHWNAAIGARASLKRLEASVSDRHPRVRLEAIVAAAAVDHPDSFHITLEAFQHPRDRFIDYALEQNSRALRHHWQPWLATNATALAERNPSANEFLQQRLQPAALVHPGRAIYTALCSNCHQPEGRGLDGIYPSLIGSPWIDATDPTALIKITLHGLVSQSPDPRRDSARSTAAGFPAPMPAMGLTDEQTAAVLSYVREQFSHHESTAKITPGQVNLIRRGHPGRAEFWTADELYHRDEKGGAPAESSQGITE